MSQHLFAALNSDTELKNIALHPEYQGNSFSVLIISMIHISYWND